MRQLFKRRLALFLAAVLVIQMSAVSTFASPKQVLGAVKTGGSDEINVDAGQEFYIGDIIFLTKGRVFPGRSFVASCSRAAVLSASAFSLKCTSSKPSVASVEKKTGLVKTKKKGTAVIKVKIGNKLTYKVTLHVQKAGTVTNTNVLKTLDRYAKKLNVSNEKTLRKRLAAYGKKLLANHKKYDTRQNPVSRVQEDGFRGFVSGTGTTDDLAVPMGARYAHYLVTKNPLFENADNSIASLCKPVKAVPSASGKAITITLKKAFTAEQLAWLKTFETPYKSGSSKVFYTHPDASGFGITVKRNGEETNVRLYLKLKKGSKKITAYPVVTKWSNAKNGFVFESFKLRKGDQVSFNKADWLDDVGVSYEIGLQKLKKFTVK